MPAAANKQQRAERDLLLFLPDEILVVDGHSRRGEAWKVRYDFASAAASTSTAGLPRDASKAPFRPAAESSSTPFRNRELPQGDYAKTVERAKEQFKVGDGHHLPLHACYRILILRRSGWQPIRGGAQPVVQRAAAIRLETFAHLQQVVAPPFFPFLSLTPFPSRRLLKRNPSPYGFFMNLGR